MHSLSTSAMYISGGDEETLQAANNLCINNEIYDAPHMALGLAGVQNIIEYNEIYNVCTETSDVGAIYGGRTWMSQGHKIRCNYMHDITKNIGITTGATVSCVYLDDMFSSARIYNNIFENVTRA